MDLGVRSDHSVHAGASGVLAEPRPVGLVARILVDHCKESDKLLHTYLRWYSAANPRIHLMLIDKVGGNDTAWTSGLNDVLRDKKRGHVVLLDDHAALPESFAITASEAVAHLACHGMRLNSEVSAQVIAGNLDLGMHYDMLSEPFDRISKAGLQEIARILPPMVWAVDGDDLTASILRLSKGTPSEGTAGPSLLELGDLP